MPDKVSPGLLLRSTLRGHTQHITQVMWSPDGSLIASSSEDRSIRLWETKTGLCLHMLAGHTDSVNSVAWLPDGSVLASGSDDGTVKQWETRTGRCLATLTGHKAAVTSVAYAPDGQTLASGSDDGTVKQWETRTGRCLKMLPEPLEVKHVTYSLDGQILPFEYDMARSLQGHLAFGSDTGIINLFKKARYNEQQNANRVMWRDVEGRLEGHTDLVIGLSFSSDGRLLASKSRDGTVRLWRTDDWKTVAIIEEPASGKATAGLAFHPSKPVLATLGEEDTVLRLWELDIPLLLDSKIASSSSLYRNAKVVLVGDSGVGKSGLGLVLTGQLFAPTESTHGRHVWTLENQHVRFDENNEELREILLWDLAGQPGYHLIHQLHLDEVSLALVLMDAHSETDPFAGVYHWDRALRAAQRSKGNSGAKLKKFLVSSRIDRAGVKVSRQRIDALIRNLDFDGFFETSAKDGRGITVLTKAIRKAIDWDALPKISSTDLFMEIKAFLVAERETDRILSSIDDLYQAFLKGRGKQNEDVRAEFETCVEQMETQGLIRKLRIDDLVLLRPELIDAYASALINAVREEPDGLGIIGEGRVHTGNFYMPADERLRDREQEQHLLMAVIEDLLRREIALRERTEEGNYLVFPSQTTRENPELPDPEQKAVIFRFEGPIQNIYATLAVRLSHSGLFELKELWHNVITYRSETGSTCGLILRHLSEGRAELTLFFEALEREEIRLHFENYVHEYLRQHALAESIQRQRIFACPNCGVQFTHAQVLRRRERGFDTLTCNVCDTVVSIADRDEELTATSLAVISAMNRSADTQREHEVAASLHSASRPRNPYYEISGVHNPEMFVGRAEPLRRLLSAAINRQSISLIGSIHIGKSSLIQHLPRPVTQRQFGYDLWNYLFVLLDLGEYIYKTSDDFLQTVSKHIIAQSHGMLKLPQQEYGADTFDAVLQQASQQGFHIVLLMDSFDNVVRNKSFGPEFFDFLRSLASAREVTYVTTSTAPLAEVCHAGIAGSPFFNIFITFIMKPLTQEEAQQLVREPSRLAGCPFTDAEIAWVLSLAGRHPFFIQRICYFLFEEKIAGDGTTDHNKVKGQVYNDLLPHFNYIWESLKTTEQDQFMNEEVSAADAQQRQFPELSESELFRDFVGEKTGKYFFQLNANELEKALQRIDDPVDLGISNLKYLKSVTRRLNSSSALTVEVGRVIREVLKEAWERLRGEGTRTDTAPDWLSYNILYYRYFHRYRLSNQQIASRIGFSTRQYYRERSKAIGELLNVLLEMEALAKVEDKEG